MGVNGAAGAEARRDDARHHVPGPDRPHHIVAATGAHHHLRGHPIATRQRGAEHTSRLVGLDERRQPVSEVAIDRGEGRGRPTPTPDVEQRGPGGVARFHRIIPSQVEIEVIVRQEHVAQPAEVGRLATPQPEDLGRGESGQKKATRRPQCAPRPTQPARQYCTLLRRAGVAPELGRTDDGALRIQRDKTVLLAGDPDAPDPSAFDPGERRLDGAVHRPDPILRMLLQMPDGQSGYQPVRGAPLSHYPPAFQI